MGFLWLFIMLSLTWPSPSGPQAPRPAILSTTRHKRGKESQPFGGLTRGEVVLGRSANVLLRGAPVAKQFRFAATDASGKWQIRARDVLTGETAAHSLELAPK